jgi:hypothetical protein
MTNDARVPGPYITNEDWGECMVCKKRDDRRYKVCFDCSDFVVTDGFDAWDTRKPEVRWEVKKREYFDA